MPAVLLATCAALPSGDEDAPLLGAALDELGLSWASTVWSEEDVEVSSSLVVLRSVWDYTEHLDGFLGWASRIPRLANPIEVVRWNTDKRYLDDLAARGVPTIPTTYPASGDELVAPGADRLVVKPTLGAGSKGAARFEAADIEDARRHVDDLVASGLTAMVQPYFDVVDVAGETALIVLDGEPSHAVIKGAMLAADTLDVPGLFRPEQIVPGSMGDAHLEVAQRSLEAAQEVLGLDEPFLYARVDLLDGPDGPVVLELELTEPSLFLSWHPASARRLARAISERL